MNDLTKIESILSSGMAQMGLHLALAPFIDYLLLLQKWNKAYNLTAIRDLAEMATLHLLDSLAVIPFINGTRLIDVGTGAGLPGIPLAIARPDCHIVLLDSIGKKTRFLQEVKRSLQLANIEIVNDRVENFHPSQPFDTVISRAFSDLPQMIKWTEHLVAKHGIWLAMKGRYPESELVAVNHVSQVKNYEVPGLQGERCCVIIENFSKE